MQRVTPQQRQAAEQLVGQTIMWKPSDTAGRLVTVTRIEGDLALLTTKIGGTRQWSPITTVLTATTVKMGRYGVAMSDIDANVRALAGEPAMTTRHVEPSPRPTRRQQRARFSWDKHGGSVNARVMRELVALGPMPISEIAAALGIDCGKAAATIEALAAKGAVVPHGATRGARGPERVWRAAAHARREAAKETI